MTNTNQMLQEAVDALQWHYDRGYPDQYTDGPRKRDARILRAIKAHLAAPGAAPSQQPAPARPDEFVCPHCFDEGAAPQAAQSGMVMVPWDPTDAMRRVGADTWHLHDGHLTRVIGDIYRAMIAAAPQAVPNPCAKIFDHKWLDPECVEGGCKSLAQAVPPEDEQMDAARFRWLLETRGDNLHGKPSVEAAWDDDIDDYRGAWFFGLDSDDAIRAAIDVARGITAKGEQP